MTRADLVFKRKQNTASAKRIRIRRMQRFECIITTLLQENENCDAVPKICFLLRINNFIVIFNKLEDYLFLFLGRDLDK